MPEMQQREADLAAEIEWEEEQRAQERERLAYDGLAEHIYGGESEEHVRAWAERMEQYERQDKFNRKVMVGALSAAAVTGAGFFVYEGLGGNLSNMKN